MRKAVEIYEDGVTLEGDLAVPVGARGIVLFAHGSDSSRLSPRNREVARNINQAGLATLLFDLLTPLEAEDRANVFDIRLLADRLKTATTWVGCQPELRDLAIGYFGASTGAAAALLAAADIGRKISAVVSRGGRPDLVDGDNLSKVEGQTLLIVGGEDRSVLELNRKTLMKLKKGELIVIPGATHLFEEPGTLEQVSMEATQWFTRFLAANPAHRVA